MKLVKCPRCDLNYIREDEKYCKVCLREMKGDSYQEEVELCSICNENPTLPDMWARHMYILFLLAGI